MKHHPLDSPLAGSDLEQPFLAPSQTSGRERERRKPLTMLPLIALIFFEVSGGPFGTEDAVRAGGPLLVLAGFLILPLLWSVPEALITAELATAFPENSGYVAWVTAAFGPFWGFQEGWWSWLSGVTDNSIYPVMFADNLRLFFPALDDGWPRLAFVMTLSLCLTYLNYRGLSAVGHTALTTTVFVAAPFVLLCGLAAPHAQPANWFVFEPSKVQLSTFINIMFWNLNYWDSISCLAGEVDNPSRTFPRALLWAVLLVVASYFLPTLAALGVSVDTSDWQLGFYGKVAQQVGGNWLAWWIVLAAAASQIGQFQAEMSSDSYQLQGMAERGFLPKGLAHRSRHGTPTYGILLSSVGVMCLSTFSFVDIVELLNAIYCLAELLEFAAYVWLRVRAPNLPRPYKVPLPTWGCVVMLAPASLLLLLILVIPLYEANYAMLGITAAAMASGFVLYPLMQTAKERGWMEFTDLAFEYEAHQTAAAGHTYTITATGALNDDPSYNAEYVDVSVDDSGIRRTRGSSMDLAGSFSLAGSLLRGGSTGTPGPGSFTSFGAGSTSAGRSPRSPLAPGYLWGAPGSPLAPAAAGSRGASATAAAGDTGGGSVAASRAGSAPAATGGAARGQQAHAHAPGSSSSGSGSGSDGSSRQQQQQQHHPNSRLRPEGAAQAGGFRAAAAAGDGAAADGAAHQHSGSMNGAPEAAAGRPGQGPPRALGSFRVRLSSCDGEGGPRTASPSPSPTSPRSASADAGAAGAGSSGDGGAAGRGAREKKRS